MFEDNLHTLSFRRSPASALAVIDPLSELRELVFGDTRQLRELPPLPDLIGAAIALASGARRKLILPLSHAPLEIALVRRGESVVVDCYGTESAPEVLVRGREVSAAGLLECCADACARMAEQGDTTLGEALRQLGERAQRTELAPDRLREPRKLRLGGGSLRSPGAHVPLAFGFEAAIVPSPNPAFEAHAFADVHALLFDGTLFAFAGDRRFALFEGPIMLAAQRMVDAVRALLEAWQAERNVHVRLRSGAFWVAVRRESGGAVALTLSGGRGDALTWPALELTAAALPILRLASDLIRKLTAADRRQMHNLRVTALKAEVRSLRRMIRARTRRAGFENADPERLRLALAGAQPAQPDAAASLVAQPSAVRYTERWSVEVDGLDAASVYLCGERIVVATQKLTLALGRGGGEVLWSLPNLGASTLLAGRTLLRLLPEGTLELHEIEDGSVSARSQLALRGGSAALLLYASGNHLPPMAIAGEGRQHLCAIDLRTGQPRWRFRARGASGVQLARSGRVLCVASGDGSLDALDLTNGEVVWRFSDGDRFCLRPAIWRDVVIAVSGEPRGRAGALYGIDLYSGRLLFRRALPAAPSAEPFAAGELVIVPCGRSQKARLLALDPATGTTRWTQPDPGLDNGAQALCVDQRMIVNAPSGRTLALDLGDGQTLWQRQLSNPLTDDVPRQLEPVLRQGALFVPSAQVHVLRPQDGSPLCQIGCDLVPDCLRLDERGWLYVAEESGHLAAYAAAPRLSLVR